MPQDRLTWTSKLKLEAFCTDSSCNSIVPHRPVVATTHFLDRVQVHRRDFRCEDRLQKRLKEYDIVTTALQKDSRPTDLSSQFTTGILFGGECPFARHGIFQFLVM